MPQPTNIVTLRGPALKRTRKSGPVRFHQPASDLLHRVEVAHTELSFVVPAYNEAGNLPTLCKGLTETSKQLGYRCEIIIIDDGSRDETVAVVTQLLDHLPLRLLRLSRNFGKERAMSAGINVARGDAVIIIDADLQHPLDLIPEFIRLWKEGNDMVYGVRSNRSDETNAKRQAARMFYQILGRLSSVPIPPDATDFRLIDRKVADALRALPENNRFMKGLYHWVGFKSIAVPFQPLVRGAGKSRYNFPRLIGLAITGLTSFSQVPLRFATMAGAAISVCSMLYATWVAGKTLIFGNAVPGWATLTTAILFLGGIQLLFIGILGEYVGRIFEEVKGRPIYIVANDSGPTRYHETTA
ncbi:glycosyltransferase family 2 protein [Luteolibacter pohnpeiensis]|uniref:Glycosyltransferase family 2 protein n=1 Tax=Luteolibacter pohnpeiensis TaxID=454153 RepID=A0A934SBD2_9BACT|nr:glycosyltransferase family 2 protein [Luteolibacter pohnpeiensis]MBK1883062.1 glycosyltransferase family 2 protein [Luteolibacter pohnpeiensis]